MRVSEIPFQNVSVDESLPGLAHGAAVGDVGHVQVEEDPAQHVGHAHLEQPREGGRVVTLLLHLCWTLVSLLVFVLVVDGFPDYVLSICRRFSGKWSSFDGKTGKRILL